MSFDQLLVALERIDAQADDLHVPAVELRLDPRHVAELGRADRREVLGMREQHAPRSRRATRESGSSPPWSSPRNLARPMPIASGPLVTAVIAGSPARIDRSLLSQADAKAVRVGRLARLLVRVRQGHTRHQAAAAASLRHLNDAEARRACPCALCGSPLNGTGPRSATNSRLPFGDGPPDPAPDRH